MGSSWRRHKAVVAGMISSPRSVGPTMTAGNTLMFESDSALSCGGLVPGDRAVSMEYGDHGPVFVEVGIVHRDSSGMVRERRPRHDAGVYCARSGTTGRLSFARSWIGATLLGKSDAVEDRDDTRKPYLSETMPLG